MKNLVKIISLMLAWAYLNSNFALAQWTTTKLTDNTKSENHAVIVVDASRVIHIVYRGVVGKGKGMTDKLFYIKKENGAFTTPVRVTNTAAGQDEYNPAIAIDEQGLHIVFRLEEYENAYALFYALFTDSPAAPIEFFDADGRYPSIAIDGSGVVHVAFGYHDGTRSDVYYTHNAFEGFPALPFNVTATLEPIGGNTYPSIAVNNEGNAYIAYIDSGNVGVPGVELEDADVSFTHNKTAYSDDFIQPVRANPHEDGVQYYFPALAIDASSAHIAYRRWEKITEGRFDCYYVRLDRDNPQTPSINDIKQVSIITDSNLGLQPPSLGLSFVNNVSLVHIVWSGGVGTASTELYYATVNTQGEVSPAERITDNSVRNASHSMALESDGTAHISYIEPDQGKRFSGDNEVWYANNSTAPPPSGGGTMHIASVDVVTEVKGKNVNGKATVLILDENDAPVESATVSGDWSGLATDHDDFQTGTDGTGSAKSDKVDKNTSSGEFIFTVTSVGKEGLAWDGVEVSASRPWNGSSARISLISASDAMPATMQLLRNYPNPFNPETSIRFSVAAPGFVEITVFNQVGQRIRQLVAQDYSAGEYSVKWDGKDDNGGPVSSGVYLYQLQAGDFIQVKKMSLLR